MRQETLTTIDGGLNRLRTKGAALKNSLYDLLNGYVTTEKTIQVRPGTVLDHTIPAGTIGLTAFDGKLHIFASSTVAGIDTDSFTLHILNSPDGAAATLSAVHFAEPFLGSLYVVAEFSDGNIYHYWLQTATTWAASTEYELYALAQPSTPDGFAYQATRLGNPWPSWTPEAPRSVSDSIEPTVYSGYYFTVESVVGANPRSGSTEPLWPTEAGAVIIEDTDDTANAPDATPPAPPPPGSELPDGIRDRYRHSSRRLQK